MSRSQTKTATATQSTNASSDHPSSLIHWNDVPHWMQDNAYIHTCYRKASYSYAGSVASVTRIHNETVNIWSHLVPGLLSLPVGAVLYSILKSRYDKASTGDVISMSCFFIGAALCMGMSATYHTLSNHSPQVAKFWNQLDYAGIACLIAGSFIPSVYYGFWCDPTKQRLYWSMVISPQILGRPLLTYYVSRSAHWVWGVLRFPSCLAFVLRLGGLLGPECSWPWACLLSSLSWTAWPPTGGSRCRVR